MSLLWFAASSNSRTVAMWAPLLAFSCVVGMLAVLLTLPFCLSRARRWHALDRFLGRLAARFGVSNTSTTALAVFNTTGTVSKARRPASKELLAALTATAYRMRPTAPKGCPGTAAGAPPAPPAPVDVEAPPALPAVAVVHVVSAEDGDGEGDDMCPICFCQYADDQQVIRLPCDAEHMFHSDCILRWLRRDATCPMCKYDLHTASGAQCSGSAGASCAAGSSSGVGCDGSNASRSSSADGSSGSSSSSGAGQAAPAPVPAPQQAGAAAAAAAVTAGAAC